MHDGDGDELKSQKYHFKDLAFEQTCFDNTNKLRLETEIKMAYPFNSSLVPPMEATQIWMEANSKSFSAPSHASACQDRDALGAA